jgi:hypothetical protein
MDLCRGLIVLILIEPVTQNPSRNAIQLRIPGEETREAQLNNWPLLDDLGMEPFCSAASSATID